MVIITLSDSESLWRFSFTCITIFEPWWAANYVFHCRKIYWKCKAAPCQICVSQAGKQSAVKTCFNNWLARQFLEHPFCCCWAVVFVFWGLRVRVLVFSCSCFGVFVFVFWDLRVRVLGISCSCFGSSFPFLRTSVFYFCFQGSEMLNWSRIEEKDDRHKLVWYYVHFLVSKWVCSPL